MGKIHTQPSAFLNILLSVSLLSLNSSFILGLSSLLSESLTLIDSIVSYFSFISIERRFFLFHLFFQQGFNNFSLLILGLAPEVLITLAKVGLSLTDTIWAAIW